MQLFKSSKEPLQEVCNVYDSIDTLPQWNWIKVHETGNLAYIKILPNYRKLKEENTEELEEFWAKIYDEFIEEFGFSENYIEVLDHKKRIAILKNDFVITDNRFLLNHIRIAENRLKEIEKTAPIGVSFRESIVMIEKEQGIKIDAKKISVADYNSYIKTMNKNGKAD